ncbi:MAG: 50S ribosomal protein L4 [Deltaproteobacteria bacterium]|nr:50S ribosomal protein L4 [Deltaproteobacteria bacterium]
MAVIDVYNLQNEKTSEIELRDDVFDVPIKKHVLHQVVVSQLNNRRSGSASTKNRSAANISGRKQWRQKGTGRARVGAASSPTRVGGGVAFGPTPRKYMTKVPKKVKKLALSMALTDKFKNNRLVVVQDFQLSEVKTKDFVDIMKLFDVTKVLIVTEAKNENLEKSSRNVPGIKVLRHEGINVYDVLNHEHILMVQPAVERIEEALVS